MGRGGSDDLFCSAAREEKKNLKFWVARRRRSPLDHRRLRVLRSFYPLVLSLLSPPRKGKDANDRPLQTAHLVDHVELVLDELGEFRCHFFFLLLLRIARVVAASFSFCVRVDKGPGKASFLLCLIAWRGPGDNGASLGGERRGRERVVGGEMGAPLGRDEERQAMEEEVTERLPLDFLLVLLSRPPLPSLSLRLFSKQTPPPCAPYLLLQVFNSN